MKIPNKGFTLLEILVVVVIVLVAFTAVFALLAKIIFVSRISTDKFTATLLAQEGIELVRNIRETNWVHGDSWDQGLSPGTYIIQHDDLELRPFEDRYLILNPRLVLYSYTEQIDPEKDIEESIFKRVITISDNPDGDPNTEDIAITSEVLWSEHGRDYSILLEDRLYDWKSL